MKIGIDLMGGDNPELMVPAINKYAEESNNTVVVFTTLDNENNAGLNSKNIELVTCSEFVDMHDDPAFVVRKKKDSTMVVGSKQLANKEIDAFISAGNTGALVACGVFIVKRMEGVTRPSLPGLFPRQGHDSPLLILDLGANIETTKENMIEQAKLGNAYMKAFYDISNPLVRLINIGSEDSKGTLLYKEVYNELRESNLNFGGNLEPRDLLNTDSDVVVVDGWTGNIILKSIEGMVTFFQGNLKRMFLKNFLTKLFALTIKGDFKKFKKDLDYKELGATPVLGVDGMLLKSHGSSDERAYVNALKKAEQLVNMKMVDKLKESLK